MEKGDLTKKTFSFKAILGMFFLMGILLIPSVFAWTSTEIIIGGII